MRRVEFFRWWVTAPGRKRPYLTSFPMDAQTAASQYPGARPEPTTREVRQVPETEAERDAHAPHRQSAGRDGTRS
jgi:hypothetical protein